VDGLWNEFVKEETEMSGLPARDLVKPAGNFHGKIIMRLPYPEFVSDSDPARHRLSDASLTPSSKIRTLIQKINHESDYQSLFLFHRPTSSIPSINDPYVVKYGQKVTDTHQKISDRIWSASSAPIGILVGQTNIFKYETSFPKSLFLPLRSKRIIFGTKAKTQEKGIHSPKLFTFEAGVYLEYREDGPEKVLTRVVFILQHPHRLRTGVPNAPNVETQKSFMCEQLLNVALVIVGRIEFRAFFTLTRTGKKAVAKRKPANDRITTNLAYVKSMQKRRAAAKLKRLNEKKKISENHDSDDTGIASETETGIEADAEGDGEADVETDIETNAKLDIEAEAQADNEHKDGTEEKATRPFGLSGSGKRKPESETATRPEEVEFGAR
jgi:hypothetical protein